MESYCKIIEGLVAIIAPPDDGIIEPDAGQAQAESPPAAGRCGAVGPAWTRGEIEAPAGTKDMGGWTAGVYTPEQQARLGVDESGERVPVPPAARVRGNSAMFDEAIAVERGESARPRREFKSRSTTRFLLLHLHRLHPHHHPSLA